MNSTFEEERKRIIDGKFKTAVHKPTVLAWLLHECIDEFRNASISEIKRCLGVKPNSTYVKGRETEIFSVDNGTVRMDNIFDVLIPGTDDKVSIILDIEGQNDDGSNEYIAKRAEYYMSRLVCRQKGVDFHGKNYKDIRRTYSLWCMMEPRKEDRNTLVRYNMTPNYLIGDSKNPMQLNTFNIIFLNLGGRYSDDLPEGLRFATALLTTNLSDDERKEVLRKKYKIPLREYPKEGLMNVSCIYEDTKRRFLREGRIESLTSNLLIVMDQLDKTLEEAFDFLKVDEEDRALVTDRLKEDGVI